MWNIKEIKKRGKRTLKNNLWTLMFVGIFMGLIVGKYTITHNGLSNIKSVRNIISNVKYENINDIKQIKDNILSEIFANILAKDVVNLNEKFNVTKGTFYVIFNQIMQQEIQIKNLIISISNYFNKTQFEALILILASLIGLMIKIFITNPIYVGESRIYLESANYKKTKLKRFAFPFKRKHYIQCVKTIFLMNFYKLLWNLTIIGGIVKNYSYKMVSYIIAENPQILPNDAITMSRKMMQGNKFEAFKLDLSFLAWHILQVCTFGIAGIYVNPYYTSTITELYKELRKNYINNKNFNYEMLNDYKLYEDNNLEKYPSEEKKLKINYDKNYELTSIILFFFTFSIAGWLWEVALYLFRDGILVNRGTFYGPWLPIYGTGCTVIILLTKFKNFRKILKNPIATFNIVMIICSIIEYFTSWYIEVTSGLKYWDYTGIFMNINGRICLECSLFFGIGGCICLYFVAPFLEKHFQKIKNNIKISICIILLLAFTGDAMYSSKHKHEGEGITIENDMKTSKN